MTQITRFNLDTLIRHHGRNDIETITRMLPGFSGDSYILNYYKLEAQSKKLKCSGDHLLNYIALASFRSYYNYVTHGDNTLDAALCPLSDNEVIINPFINRYENRIHFLLEPSPTEPFGK